MKEASLVESPRRLSNPSHTQPSTSLNPQGGLLPKPHLTYKDVVPPLKQTPNTLKAPNSGIQKRRGCKTT